MFGTENAENGVDANSYGIEWATRKKKQETEFWNGTVLLTPVHSPVRDAASCESRNATHERHKDPAWRGEGITRVHHRFIVEDENVSRRPDESVCALERAPSHGPERADAFVVQRSPVAVHKGLFGSPGAGWNEDALRRGEEPFGSREGVPN